MDASMLKGIVIGGVAAIAVAASGVTGYKVLTRPPAFADVVAVKEVTETINTPVEQCSEAQVQKKAPTNDAHRVTGSVIGAVAGGLLGNAVGGKGATVAGAAIGGVAGHEVQRTMQDKNVVTTTETHCTTVNEASQRLVGYDVTYRLDGKQDVVRMDFDPGKQIPVKDGQLVLTPPAPTTPPAQG
jgi:uncharacterized protein YcfJ